jgi:hypothetical protein
MKKILMILVALLCVGCSINSLRWVNTTIHIFPEDQQDIYVKYGNGKFRKERNGENYQVDMVVKEDNYKLVIHSYGDRIDIANFDGACIKPSEEIDWKRLDDHTIYAEGKLITGYDFYEIFLTLDRKLD